MAETTRSEKEVFADLEALCCEPGYIHAVANLFLQSNINQHSNRIQEADTVEAPPSKLYIQTEINTLLGLMIKAEVDWDLPAQETVEEHINKTKQLLDELQSYMLREPSLRLTKQIDESGSNLFSQTGMLRESIFYGAEPAYSFQYLDLAPRKYTANESWIQANFGFTMDQASRVGKAIEKIQTSKSKTFPLSTFKYKDAFPLFTFKAEDIVEKTNFNFDVVDRILCAFTPLSTERNEEFATLSHFNIITARPLLRMPTGEFWCLQFRALAKAIYDSPYYWMREDEGYKATLMKSRCDFTEEFIAERLTMVFGTDHVYSNVQIPKFEDSTATEIDVLVVWGDRVVIVQAKSKILTLKSREGDDQAIQCDFKKGAQAAYDQGVKCAEYLLGERPKLETSDEQEIKLPQNIKEIYIFCVVGDNYPTLNLQAKEFLQTESIDRVQAPLAMDIFAIDLLTEMLQSPLYFLSYANRRANYSKEITVLNEYEVLDYHLKKNLWVSPYCSWVSFPDGVDLDDAMTVRRTSAPGAATPDGILTWFDNTTMGQVIKEIGTQPDPEIIDLGFLLLAMNKDIINQMSEIIDELADQIRADGKLNNAEFNFKEGGSGITLYCTDESEDIAKPLLESYCESHKYKAKATEWFGLCISSTGPNFRFGVSRASPWTQNADMDERTKGMQKPMPIKQGWVGFMKKHARGKKPGRNEPCPCGSGLKYKKCCLK